MPRSPFFFRAVALGAALVVPGVALAAGADTLPLRHVTLSTAGLAQFVYQGQIEGNAQVTMPVRLDQVDDVLKSLVVLDDGGSFGGVSLPGREPLDAVFRDLPFSQADLRAPEALLGSLQGAEVTATAGTEAMSGKLIAVVPEQAITKDQQVVRRHRVSIMTADGLRSAILEDIKSLRFTEPNVQAQLDRALAATHAYRVQDTRDVMLDLRGDGARDVAVSYVTAAPVWKSAYRLVLPEGDSGAAYMQGWAILENTTGQDWTDITMTLLSGNPVTYRQDLYQSYYRDRPYLPLRVMDMLMPRTDTGGVVASPSAAGGGHTNGRMEMKKTMRAPAPAMAMESLSAADMGMAGMAYAEADATLPMARPQIASTVAATTEESSVHLAFRFPQTLTLKAGGSMMLPIIARNIPAEPVSLYQPETNPRHPLHAVSLRNDSGTGLPPGILTLYAQTESGPRYTGDAELAMLPDGESRYVTFALDPETTIDREMRNTRQHGAFGAAKGVVRQRIVTTETMIYTIAVPKDADRTLVIEHPRHHGWDLKTIDSLEGDVEKTQAHYRLKFKIKAGETRNINVTQERVEHETLSIGGMAPGDLTARMAASADALTPEARKALEGAIALQADLHRVQADIFTLEQERQNIYNDQQRLRENIDSIPAGSDVAKRYLAQLNTQEDRLVKINADITTLNRKHAEAQSKLADYIAGMAF